MKLKLEELQKIGTEILKEVVTICQNNEIEYFLVYGSALGAVRHSGPIPWDYDVDIAIPYPSLPRFLLIMRKELPEKFYVNFNDNDSYYPELLPRIGLKGYSSKILHLDVFLLIGAPEETRKHFVFQATARFYTLLFKFKNFNELHFGKFTSLKQKVLVPIIKAILFPLSNRLIQKKFAQLCNKYSFNKAQLIVNAQFGYGMKEFIPKSYYGEGKLISYQNFKVKIPENHDAYLTHIYGNYMEFPPEKERTVPEFFDITSRESPHIESK